MGNRPEGLIRKVVEEEEDGVFWKPRKINFHLSVLWVYSEKTDFFTLSSIYLVILFGILKTISPAMCIA
jgi:hypothetical protein